MHFTTLVIGDNIHEQLADFDEHNTVKVVVSKDEIVLRAKNELDIPKKEYYAYIANPKEFLKRNYSQEHLELITKVYKEKLTWNYDQLHQNYIRYYEADNINPDGSVNEYYSPNGRYDWYEVGGRWSGMLLLKPGAESGTRWPRGVYISDYNEKQDGYDSALVKDIDFNRMEEENKKRIREENKELKEEGKKQIIIKPRHYKFYTQAIVKDKEWLELNNNYLDSNEENILEIEEWVKKTENIIKSLPEDTRLTIVDCHV